jgi:hypothetical protein
MHAHLRFHAGVLAILLGCSAAVSGHHSFAAFYFESESVTMEGEVVEFALRAPHAWVYFTANDEQGRPQRFGAEWGNPRRLERDGVDKDTFQPGDRVSITGAPGRDASLRQIHLKQVVRSSRGEWTWPTGRRRPR